MLNLTSAKSGSATFAITGDVVAVLASELTSQMATA
jgi:hypothetical protein